MFNGLTLLFLGALVAATGVQLWLARRQIRHVREHRDVVPWPFVGDVTLEAHRKAANYTVAKTRFGIVEAVFGAVVLVVLTCGGVIDWLDSRWARLLAPNVLAQGVALSATAAILLAVIELPFSIYRTFVIEARFGFNRVTPRLSWPTF